MIGRKSSFSYNEITAKTRDAFNDSRKSSQVVERSDDATKYTILCTESKVCYKVNCFDKTNKQREDARTYLRAEREETILRFRATTTRDTRARALEK